MTLPTILIIDDDPNLRKTLADILTIKGYEPLAAKDGAEGITVLKERTPLVALIDLGLPDMTGLDVLKRVRAESPSTEAIILTGNATLDSAIEATNRGAFSYILKPYDIDQLLLHIRRAMEKRQAEDEIARANAELALKNEELQALYKEAQASSLHDSLTGLPNRRYLDIQLKRSLDDAKRYKESLSVILLDIDHFKKYNDTRGHVEGDRLLAGLAKVLQDTVRSADSVFRYGGEEFLVLLPRTGAAQAFIAAERLRKAVEERTSVTVSLGIAALLSALEGNMIEHADRALYRAKQHGRNRAVVWNEGEEASTLKLKEKPDGRQEHAA